MSTKEDQENNTGQQSPEKTELVSTQKNSSENSISSKEYKKTIDSKLEHQWQLIYIFIGVITIILTILLYLFSSKITNFERMAERELKRVEDIRKKAEKIVDVDMQNKFDELMIVARKQIEDLQEKNTVYDQLINKLRIDEEQSPLLRTDTEKVVAKIKKIPEKERTAVDHFILASDEDDYDKRIELYTKSIELKPDYPEAHNNRGLAYSDKGEHNRAIQDLDKAIELNPYLAVLYYNRGIVFTEAGKDSSAIQDYSKAIKLNPYLAEAYTNRGNAYLNKDEHDLAMQDYDKAIEVKPDLAEAYSSRGVAYSKKDELDRAIVNYNTAIELNPDYEEAYYNKACTLALKGEIKEALDNLDIAANKGFKEITTARSDEDLVDLRSESRFEEILKKIEENAKGK